MNPDKNQGKPRKIWVGGMGDRRGGPWIPTGGPGEIIYYYMVLNFNLL